MNTNQSISFIRLAAVALLFLSACGGAEQEPAVPDSHELVPLAVSAAVEGTVDTRATTTLTSGSIGIFCTAGYDAAIYDREYTYSTNKWTAATPIYLDGRTATLCAYHPRTSVTFTNNTSTATLLTQAYAAAKDMSYATTGGANVCNKTPAASFSMKRAYARLKITLKRHATNYIGTCKVASVTLNSPASCTLNIQTGSYGANTTGANASYTLNATLAAGGSNGTTDFLLPPQTVAAAGMTVTVNVDGVNRSVAILKNVTMAAGSWYGVTLTLTDAAITVGGTVTVGDWGTQTNTDADLTL